MQPTADVHSFSQEDQTYTKAQTGTESRRFVVWPAPELRGELQTASLQMFASKKRAGIKSLEHSATCPGIPVACVKRTASIGERAQ